MPRDDNTALSDQARHSIELALRDGRKIEAIKLYRGATGADLLQAKEAVEAMLEAEPPPTEGDPAPIRPSGCVVLVAVACLAATTLLAALA